MAEARLRRPRPPPTPTCKHAPDRKTSPVRASQRPHNRRMRFAILGTITCPSLSRSASISLPKAWRLSYRLAPGLKEMCHWTDAPPRMRPLKCPNTGAVALTPLS